MSQASDMTDAASAPGFKLQREPGGGLLFTAASGEQHADVVPVRAFPLAAPNEGISLVSTEGHEVAWIEQLQALPTALRSLLEDDLALRDFVPEIRRLKSVSTYSTPSVWSVETDRGDTSFVLQGEEDIRRLAGWSLLIAGSQGVQYSVRDMTALDRNSRRLLERFL